MPLEDAQRASKLHRHKVNYSPLRVIINNCQPEGVTHWQLLENNPGHGN